jgi:ribosomal protein L13E
VDDAMIAKLLQTYGAQPSVKNANAARAFFASNPEIAEKRAMGMRGSGIDDNSDIFGAQLEQFMQEAEAAAPPGRVEVGPIEQVETPAPAPAPVQRAAPAKMSNMPAQPGQNRQANYGSNGPITREAARGGRGFGLDDILLAFLGLRAAGGNAPDTRPQKAQPRAIDENGKLIENPFDDRPTANAAKANDPNRAPAPYAEDTPRQRPTPTYKNERGTAVPIEEPRTQSQAEVERLKAEVDAENAEAKRLQDQIMERQRAQVETKKLSDAAKRAIGRR